MVIGNTLYQENDGVESTMSSAPCQAKTAMKNTYAGRPVDAIPALPFPQQRVQGHLVTEGFGGREGTSNLFRLKTPSWFHRTHA